MSVTFRYEVYDLLAGVRMGSLDPKESVWTESVNGGSTWSGKVTVPAESPVFVQNLQQVLSLGNSLFIKNPEGSIPWCGYISKVGWNPLTNEVSVQATEWRSYLYRLLAAPADNYAQVINQFTATDQFTIARTILGYYTGPGLGTGVPQIQSGTGLSGVNRDLLIRGTLFRYVGTWIDSMANRDNGFEWDIEGGRSTSGVPQLTLQMYYPQRGGKVDGLVFQYGLGGNMLAYDTVEVSNDDLVTRVWTIGSGPDNDNLPYAQDSDPDMMAGASILRLEKSTTYQDVILQPTLESYARAERQFYSLPLSLFSFTVLLTQPYIGGYAKGDRCRIIVKDRWLDYDLDNVRIIERTIDADKGLAKITVDLSDFTLPDSDPNGTV